MMITRWDNLYNITYPHTSTQRANRRGSLRVVYTLKQIFCIKSSRVVVQILKTRVMGWAQHVQIRRCLRGINTCTSRGFCCRNSSALKVRLGDWDIYRDVEPWPHVERPVASIVVHPEYSPSTMHNDIAVITLSGAALPITSHVSPVCLPPAEAVSPLSQWSGCRVSGWGAESFDRPRYPGVLKKVPVPLWDHQRCVDSLKTTRLGAAFKLHAGFLCAGGEMNEDACKVSKNGGIYPY